MYQLLIIFIIIYLLSIFNTKYMLVKTCIKSDIALLHLPVVVFPKSTRVLLLINAKFSEPMMQRYLFFNCLTTP